MVFKKLTRAYEVLSDGDKRALYEAGGMEAVEKGTGQRDMWGNEVGVQRGNDVSVTVSVPLEDVYKGGNVRVEVARRVVCRGCRNQGRRSDKPQCAGCGPTCPAVKRVVQHRRGMMIYQQEVRAQRSPRAPLLALMSSLSRFAWLDHGRWRSPRRSDARRRRRR